MASYITARRLREALSGFENDSVWILNSTQLAIGPSPPNPSKVFDLSTEQVVGAPNAGPERASSLTLEDSASQVAVSSRRTGLFWFELLGKRVECTSMKEMLAEALRALESARPGTLEKLTQIKPRNRRIVARNRDDLFDNQNLRNEIHKYSERLTNEWWLGTNNSEEQINTWLLRAAKQAGLKVPSEFKLSLYEVDDLVRLAHRPSRRRRIRVAT